MSNDEAFLCILNSLQLEKEDGRKLLDSRDFIRKFLLGTFSANYGSRLGVCFYTQGSFAMNTIIKNPQQEIEYDLDDVLMLKLPENGNSGSYLDEMLALREFVFHALKLLKTASGDTIKCVVNGDKCLKVIYNNYKIDVPLIGERSGTQEILVENHLEETRSRSFIGYFSERTSTDNFRKLIKIFKIISKLDGNSSLSSLSITVILQEVLKGTKLNGKIHELFQYTLNRLIDRFNNDLYIYSPVLENTRSLDSLQKSKNFLKSITEIKNNDYKIP
ncbi:MAG: hypothetical protein LBP39_02245 [Rickettsiales bacterium]|jgi:hypothetical protein|nr:hypothetical protein [Rickettsiales bacterium]